MTVSLLPGQCVSHYEVVNELGSGAFATVYTCIDRRTPHNHQQLALKVISKRDLDKDQLQLTKLEVDIHAKLPQHPHIVGLKEWFEDPSALYLVMDRCDYGDLYDLVAASSKNSSGSQPKSAYSTRRGLPDAISHRYLTQMTQALDLCHKQGVYHRDLKPENMLLAGPLDRQGFPMHAKLADFGLATRDPFSTELGLGTRSYLAPECLDESIDGYASAPADVFALALVALQLSHPGVRLWKATVPEDRDWAAWVRAVNDQQVGQPATRRYQPPHMVRMMHRHAPTSSAAASTSDPVAQWFAQRHPQLSASLQRLLARALDPVPSRRATLPEFARLLEAIDCFSCRQTPALLVAPLHGKNAPRARAEEEVLQQDAMDISVAPPTSLAVRSSSVRSDISDMDFAAVMGHHDDDLMDDEDMYREYHEDEVSDDDDDDHHMLATPAVVDTIPVPKPTASLAAIAQQPKTGLPLVGIAPHLAPVPTAIPNYIPPHLVTLKHSPALGSSSVKPSPIALAAAAGASAPRPAWTAALTKMAPTTASTSSSGVFGSSPAFGTPHSAMVDWSEYDDDDDDVLLDGTTGTATSSLSLFMTSAMHGAAVGRGPPLPPTRAQAVPAPKAPSPVTSPLGHDAAVALTPTDAVTAGQVDADGKVRQESLDSAIGVSLTQGINRLRV